MRFPVLFPVLCIGFRLILSYPPTHTPDKEFSRTEVAFHAMHVAHSTTLATYSHFVRYVQMPLFCNTPDTRICHLSNKGKKDC